MVYSNFNVTGNIEYLYGKTLNFNFSIFFFSKHLLQNKSQESSFHFRFRRINALFERFCYKIKHEVFI